ncbi:MAG: hypothetical protein WAQ53_15415 [Thiofilum sp.]|uniref:hypothetical protein n=1 Tax=Thiofilum sp. TaxID=2212733 RepID=UPI0025E656E3|nr:hypothetical protein [Thiofilum sp.]MBK8451763.1 hypothetical protein [Thiofilum sp.]
MLEKHTSTFTPIQNTGAQKSPTLQGLKAAEYEAIALACAAHLSGDPALAERAALSLKQAFAPSPELNRLLTMLGGV